LDDPPKAISTAMAFLNASRVIISRGFRFFSTNSKTFCPAVLASLIRPACTAGIVPFPGRPMPSASERQFMEFAVNIPLQEPCPGQAHCSRRPNSSSDMSPPATFPTPSKTEMRSTGLPLNLPASIGPPLIKIHGMLSLKAAIIIPGIILSQFGISTRPSKG